MRFTQHLQRALARHPDALATQCGGRRHSFRQMHGRVARLAAALRGLGVQPGDRVGVLALNSDRYLEAYMAVPWAGAVIQPVNTRWSLAEIARTLDDCDTRVLLVDDSFAAAGAELRQRSTSLRTLVHAGDGPAPDGQLPYEGLLADHAPLADAGRGGRDLLAVFYTGGTTGSAKGVMVPHQALVYNGLVAAASGFARDGERGLHVAPLFHGAAATLMGALWTVGGAQLALPAFTPAGVLQAIERERIHTTVLVPTMLQMLVDHPDAAAHDLGSLRLLAYGASPISEALLDRALRLLPHTGFLQCYGMTELAPMITLLMPELHVGEGRARGKIGSAGQPIVGVELRVVDARGRDLAVGEVGEVIVRSPAHMLGYWNRPEDTAQALQREPNPGWMHTGDAGWLDDEGFITLVDRLKDMIVSGGENVYSAEVEQAVSRHPAVAACAVIGVPDERWGERVHAVVVLKPGHSASAEHIAAHCRTLIGGYKCPKSVDFVDALPLSGAGKVLKTQLREPYWAGRGRRVG